MKELQEFERYLAHLGEGLGHVDRQAGLRGYCTGLMAPLKRKSVEPMAAHLAPSATRSRHQSLHHFVADSAWSDEQMLLRVAQWVVPAMDFSDGGWWIVDDTGFPKQGQHSVGVARQYCGMLGKQDNCQVAVSVTLACQAGSLPVAWQLYLPQEWAEDVARREKAGVPQDLVFATKPAIALAQIERLMEQGAPKHCVLADAGYGVDTAFRERLSELGLAYVVGVTGQVTVWPPGHAPLPPEPYSGRGKCPPGSAWAMPSTSVRSRSRNWRSSCSRPSGRPSNGARAPHLAIAICPRSRACSAPRSSALAVAPSGVASHRVARGPPRTDEVLAVHAARGRAAAAHGVGGQDALAHRARLPGPQAGTGAGTLRRQRLARVPPPRQPEHRRLRLLDGPAASPSGERR